MQILIILCKIVSDLQLFVDKSVFLEEKAHFFGSKTADQRFGEMQKKTVFCCKILAFLRFFAAKTLKKTISTSVWSAQHPNAGRNIQQSL